MIALACCLFGCERNRVPIIDPYPPEPEPPTPRQVVLYPMGPGLGWTERVYGPVDMRIDGVEAFKAKTTPEVILKISGAHGDGCISGNESRAYYRVDGRTITVWGTKHIALDDGFCTDQAFRIGIALYIGQLEAGAYKVVSQSGYHLLTFHTDNLRNMTFYDCYPQGRALPDALPPDIDGPEDCAKYKY